MCTLLRSVLHEGELKGLEKGIEQGIEQGIGQGKAQVIATLLESMSIEQAAKLLHLSVAEVEKYLQINK